MKSPNQRRKDPKLVASAILIALIVIAAIVLVGTRLTGGNDNPTARQPQTTSGPKTSASSSTCGLPDGDQTIPTEAPKTKWYFRGKIATPRSPSFGPGQNDNGTSVRKCFARNPEGVLFAAATLAADIYPLDNRTKQTLKMRTVPNPELDETLHGDLGKPGPISQLVGFRFEDYTKDRSTVTLATRLTDGPNAGALGATPMTFVWRQGDWYLQLQQTSEPIVLTSLDGFTKWSGVS